MDSRVRALPAIGLLLASGAACAGSSTAATLDALVITLVDLAPGDGIAPSISFVDGHSRASAVVFQPFGVFDDDIADGSSPWADAGAAVTLSLGRVTASLGGAGANGQGASLQLTGQAAEPGTPMGSAVQYQGQVWAPYAAAGAFIVSPWTAVTISAQSHLTVTTQSSGTSHDSALAGSYLFLHDTGDVMNLACDSVAGRQCHDDQTRLLSVSFSNAAATSAATTFQAWSQVAGFSQAVPEPAAPWLMLAGLAGLSRVIRVGPHAARAGRV